jgi:ParB/RepB/Spo0J family partition protein
MGNERSGRGGIEFAVFRRIERMLASGFPVHQVARETGIDRKTVQKVADGQHVFQRKGAKAECPICGHVVESLPCMFCSVAPLEVEPAKVDPQDLTDAAELFARDETAAEMFPQLVASVKEIGMIQAPLVTEDLSTIILGGRRVRAAIEAGLPVIWVGKVRANKHRQYDALLTEEFLRVERTAIERGRMFAAALADPDCGHTQKTLGERIGRSQSYVAHHVNLLRLPDYWQDLIRTRVLSEKHARWLIPHADNERLLAEVWRDLHGEDPGTVRHFRALIEEAEARFTEDRKDREGGEGESELVRPPATSRKRGPELREVKFKFAAEAAESIELRLDAIRDAEGCESREETLELLVNYYWENKPRTAEAAALGLRKVA